MRDYDEFIPNDKNFLKKHNNIYISDSNIEILKRYDIDIDKYINVNELIRDIEEILNVDYYEDLDYVSSVLAEYNYYNNTNK